MPIRFTNQKRARDVRPGEKVQVFDEWYWVRYIDYLGGKKLNLRLQHENEPLSPFYENDKIVITMPDDLVIDVEV